MKSLKEIVEQLRDCGYTCEAGPLENNADFRLLAEMAGVELSRTLFDCVDDACRAIKAAGVSLEDILKTPQQVRDEIIEKAKRDLAELETFMQQGGYRNFKTKSKYVVNSRAVIALVSIDAPKGFLNNGLLAKGIAKADPTDCFNVHIGKAIALRRALGLEVPAEYLSVPQPTEVRVGDVVYLNNAKCNMDATPRVVNEMNRQHDKGYVKVIDDTRE